MTRRVVLLILLAVAVTALVVSFKFYHCNCRAPVAANAKATGPSITMDGHLIKVLIADTDASREQGLSNHAPLPPDTGMLFIFPEPAEPGFWMKDMKFSLDMIWVDEKGQVTDIDKDISPETYPNVYWPSRAIKYVLEVPSGFAQGHGIDTGDQVYFAL